MPETMFLRGLEKKSDSLITGDPDSLRAYQRTAVNAWISDLKEVRGALGVMFTGSGKTRTAVAWIRNAKGRGLWLAMKDFLIDQAAETIRDRLGEFVGIEKAEQHMGGERIVIGSVQTLKGKRLASIPADAFDWIVFDEAHHAVAPGPRAIFDHFKKAKIIGLTATPYRLDKVGLHNVFQRMSFEYTIQWGIEQGFFAPVVPIRHDIDSIDISEVKTTMGDLQVAALEKETIKAAAQIARIAYDESDRGGLPFLVYTPGVASAHIVAETLRHLSGDDNFAASVDQDTPKWRRRGILASFGTSLRGIVNCQIYTEGLDVPRARCIVIARLTESLSLYQQMAGRGGRTSPGCSEKSTRDERITAIAQSDKPWFKLVDITGKAGKHSLITAFDALAGKDVTDAEKNIAKKIIKEQPGIKLDDATKLARIESAKLEKEELERNAKAIAKAASIAKVSSRRSEFDAFTKQGDSESDLDGIEPVWLEQKPTAIQLKWLRDNKLPDDVSRGKAAQLQKQARQWQKQGLASFKQRRTLERFKLPVDISGIVASRLISALSDAHWKPWAARKNIDRILSEGRNVGEEG